jgi:RNA polymerase primary sigma factor
MPTPAITDPSPTRPVTPAESLNRYMTEIGRYPLLTRSQEVVLAGRIAAGDDVARRRLIECNLRLVASIAREFQRSGVDQLDLIQEGTVGLIAAVDRYDAGAGAGFATYACWWIRHAMLRGLAAHGRTIRLPESMLARIGDVRRAERALTARLGHVPGDEQIAAELEISPEQVTAARRAAQPTGSLDQQLADDGAASVLDTVVDVDAPDMLESLAVEQRRQLLERSLGTLTPRARWVLEHRYGLNGAREQTLAEIADALHISSGRARQIEITATRRLALAADDLVREAA